MIIPIYQWRNQGQERLSAPCSSSPSQAVKLQSTHSPSQAVKLQSTHSPSQTVKLQSTHSPSQAVKLQSTHSPLPHMASSATPPRIGMELKVGWRKPLKALRDLSSPVSQKLLQWRKCSELSNTVPTSHLWLLSTWYVASVMDRGIKFLFIYIFL